MAKKLRSREVVNGYQIIELINVGALALAYSATSSAGEKVFLKQYKSPTVTVDWYRGYVDYQGELKRRIETNAARGFTIRFVDFFEAVFGHPCYFQVFEFVEEGHDLEVILEKLRRDPSLVSWEQRIIFAKVIMAGVNALHQAGVVHCDLKPANIQLFADDSIKAGWVVKLIDMDYSILVDRLAPWHGVQGYVGTPGYFSPEHLAAGGVPLLASDVFTCGLILYELLTGSHPYADADADQYQTLATSHRATKVKLLGNMPAPANDAKVSDVLWRCLSPDPENRPSAQEVLAALNGVDLSTLPPPPKDKPSKPASRPPIPTPMPTPAPTKTASHPASSPPPAVPSRGKGHLRLVAESGRDVQMRITTPVGRRLLQHLGEDARYFHSDEQFRLEILPDGAWYVRHNQAAKHETLLNGKAVTAPTQVNHGDVLAVGKEMEGIQKLPLKVSIS